MGRDGTPQRPRLPNDIDEAHEIRLSDELGLTHVTILGDYSELVCVGMTIEEARISRASFVGTDLHRLRLTDVLVEGADFSGANLEEASLTRVEFKDCRMSGLNVPSATLRDVVFSESKVKGANFRMVEGERVLFDHVDLQDTEFTAAKLKSACFFDCDLSQVEFLHVALPGARFHGSSHAEIKGAEYLRDAIIESSQVLPLALRVFSSLGISIDDEREIPE